MSGFPDFNAIRCVKEGHPNPYSYYPNLEGV